MFCLNRLNVKNNYYFDINFNFAKTKLKINNNFEENKIKINNSKVLKCFWPKCEYKTKYSTNLREHQLIHKNKLKNNNNLKKIKKSINNIKIFSCFWPKCDFNQNIHSI